MDYLPAKITSLLAADLDFVSSLKFIALLAAAALVAGLIGRILFGKHSAFNHAVSSSIGILFIYLVTAVIYTFNTAGLSRFLTPLPYVDFYSGYLHMISFAASGIPVICKNILSMILLSFLVNTIGSIIPKGKSPAKWFFLRIISVVLAMGLHYFIDMLCRNYLPDVLVTYAPILLLVILLASFLLGALNVILSLLLIMVHPIVAGIYAFFFSNILGKQLSKAILTTILISAVFLSLQIAGYGTICINAAALLSFTPLIFVLLLLWYLVGNLL